ncbi:bacteriocin immunity protein [Pseudomonas sp. NFX71]|uniref:bacteriocin immunity protein n=1 Tax=Pseudomonas sp. NFX71 TaxID=3399121 RepID=UPI003A89BB2A
MELKTTLKDYTALEFQALVNQIWAVDLPKSDHDRLINHFDRIVGHPQGADLLFYPMDKSNTNTPEAVVHHVRTWHHQQGIPAFKDEDVPVAKPLVAPLTPLARSLAEVEKIAADVAVSGQVVEEAFGHFELQIRNFQRQKNTRLDIPPQETGIRALEHAQHEALIAVRKFQSWKMRVEFVQSGAQRNLTYARSEQAQWQSIVQQINATHDRYLLRLESLSQRHRALHDEAEALLIVAHQRLIDSRSTIQTVHTISASLDSAHKRPDLLLTGGSPVLLASQQADLLKAIRSTVAGFSWQNASGGPDTENQRAAVLSFAFSSRADAQIFGVSVPLSELLPIEGQDWQHLAAHQAEVEVPFRMSTAAVPARPGKMFQGLREIKTLSQVYLNACRGCHSISGVRVRAATQDQHRNRFSFTPEGAGVAIHWARPIFVETAPAATPTHQRRVGFVESARVPTIEAKAERAHDRFDDYILVFPVSSGLDPLYIVFNRPAK